VTAVADGLTLVVPLFDESGRFLDRAPDLCAFVRAQPEGSELVFVDDGSSDGTAHLVREFIAQRDDGCVRLLERPHRGKGAAVQAGLLDARAPYAAFCDLDLSTPLAELGRLVDLSRTLPGIVIGSRDVAESRLVRHQGTARETLGKAFNRAVQLLVVPGVRDTQCGAKVAPTAVWREVLAHTSDPGFAWDVEVLAVARALGHPIHEIGVEWSHDDLSRVRVLRDGLGMVAGLWGIRRRARRIARSEAARAAPGASQSAAAARRA
jgi:dolichyl-phosphate beta-glucosyltransferase